VELSREGDKRKPGGVAGLAASAAAAARWSPGGNGVGGDEGFGL